MLKCTVPMYGLPYEITTLREDEVELEDGAGMADVITALRQRVPALRGLVFRPGEDRLRELYKFNVNGQLHFGGTDFKLRPGDCITLLVPVTGG
jgi:molybdopterin converting factor small subunit